eukprot:COSAG02_NODE_32076_length_522_cov_1.583924_1_plen_45_part_10
MEGGYESTRGLGAGARSSEQALPSNTGIRGTQPQGLSRNWSKVAV